MKTIMALAALLLFAGCHGSNGAGGRRRGRRGLCRAGLRRLPRRACRTSRFSPLPEAPTFQSVADTPGMTEMALTVWLQSSHPTMPNIVLKQDDLRNVVAYIRSLEKKN